MSDVMWVALLGGGLVVLWLMRFVVATYARADAALERLIADGLAVEDCVAWDAEMCSQSPLFDDDGWLR